tara:strand:+ start:3657 stop:4370 length:714 start_codon:yes stop_codon:yes gene_type:complete
MKRFTDTDKWRDEWFMDLSLVNKAAWQYLLDRCDSIGHWKQNFRLANFEIGEDVDWDEFLTICGDRIHVTDAGYWFVVAFVDFQYGALKEACRPHQSYLRQLKDRKLLTLTKGYRKGFETLKEKDKDKDKDKEEETDKDNSPKILPILTPIQQDLHSHFKRRESTAWSDKERKAYRSATAGKTAEEFAEEVALVLADQAKSEYPVKSLETLLNNWSRKIDEASMVPAQAQPKRPKIG